MIGVSLALFIVSSLAQVKQMSWDVQILLR